LSRIYKASTVKLLEPEKYTLSFISSPQPTQRQTDMSGEELVSPSKIVEEKAAKVLVDAEEMAAKIIEQAKVKAAQLRQQAESEADTWRVAQQQQWNDTLQTATADGFKEGFAEGKATGLKDATEEMQWLLDQAKRILEQAYQDKEQIIAEAEPFLVDLSVTIARKVIQQELQQHPDQLTLLISEMILRSKETDAVAIFVHPDCYEFVQSERTKLQQLTGGEVEIKVYPDPAVAGGGCILRTSWGSVDARVDMQLEEIKEVLLRATKDEQK
jgi:flagellar assembly protein FliH